MNKKEIALNKKAWARASNKTLLSDVKGMDDGKYVKWGLKYAKEEIVKRKKSGMMRKSAGIKKKRSYDPFDIGDLNI